MPVPPAALLAWLAVIQTLALLFLVPLGRLLVGLRDDVREVKAVVTGPTGAEGMGLVERMRGVERVAHALETDVNHLYGVVRLLHPDLPERAPRHT